MGITPLTNVQRMGTHHAKRFEIGLFLNEEMVAVGEDRQSRKRSKTRRKMD